MKIISKYILKEHAGPLLFAFTALTSLLLLNYIARQLGQLVGKGLGWQVIGEFLLLSVPFTFAMTVPMAVLVSTLYAFSRLASENEVTALKASGVSMWRLLTPVLVMGALFSAGMLVFNDQVLPRSNHRLAQLQYDIVRTKPTFALKEQVINELQRERLYLRASRVLEGTSRLTDVTVYDLSDPLRRRTIYADSGKIALAPNMRDLHMTLYDGVMHEVPTSDPTQLTRLFYSVDRIRVPDVASQFQQTTQGQTKSDREMTVCEMSRLADVADVRRRQALNQYERSVAELARATGKPAPEPKVVSLKPSPTLGSAYCGLVTRLAGLFGGPDTLHAATPSQQPPQARNDAPPLPDAARRKAAALRWPQRAQGAPGAPGTPGAANAAPARPAQPDTAPAAPPAVTPAPVVTPDTNLAVAAVDTHSLVVGRDDAKFQVQANRNDANRYLVEIHKKFSLAVACFAFVLVGAPVALRVPRGGVGLTLGVSFAIFGLYYVGLISGESLADRNIMSPGLAMWSTNILMLIVGLVLTVRMGHETGSHRGGGGLGEVFARARYRRRISRSAA
ncbi:MAG TPA: LptF/LptG family permease [Gemmatimonadaceae bacterium]|nr:LptF/LptG family permease [Gemmatimonadaceae bacterium]